jgi:hypothetical protein
VKKLAILCASAVLLLLPAATPAFAQAEIVRSQVALDDIVDIPGQDLCGTEYDLIRIQIEFTVTDLVDGNGGSHFKLHSKDTYTYRNPTTGAVYLANGLQNTSINPNVTSLVAKRKLVIPGAGNNYSLTATNKVVINGNGELVVDKPEFAVQCR